MFIGHHAAGLLAKRYAPRASLTILLSAALLLDLLWPLFLLTGGERVAIKPGITAVTPLDFVSYPYTHSLASSCVWALLFAGIYYYFTRYRRGAIVVALCVVSHWFLDFISHRADLPLYPGDAHRYGLGLWYSITWTIILEGGFFLFALAAYVSVTRPLDKWGKLIFYAYVLAMLLLYAGNIFGPPPSSATALALFALIAWLIVPWAYFIDLHRTNRRAR
jgi:hypothetical protein